MADTPRLVSVMVGLELPCDEFLTELAAAEEYVSLWGLFGLDIFSHDGFLRLGLL